MPTLKSDSLTIPASGAVMFPKARLMSAVRVAAVQTNGATVRVSAGSPEAGYVLSPVDKPSPGSRAQVTINEIHQLSDLWLYGRPGDGVTYEHLSDV